jgi:hypothetical protein
MEFEVGDRVRVKGSVSMPREGWGPYLEGTDEVGVVAHLSASRWGERVFSGTCILVDFPCHAEWIAWPDELELAGPQPLFQED